MYRKLTIAGAREMIEQKLYANFNKKLDTATEEQLYKAVVLAVRDILDQTRKQMMEQASKNGTKQVYYLCMEFLLGRSLKNTLFNLRLESTFARALKESGVKLENLYEIESDAGLGNGGLGRLAACFLDSLATQGIPATGYCIRYEYGIFKQKLIDGWQTELPDVWLPGGDTWLVERPDEEIEVRFEGEVQDVWRDGFHYVEHTGYNCVKAIPCDMMISGYNNKGVSRLRLFRAKSPGIDMKLLNEGRYMQAMEQNAMAEVISKVLYPADNHVEGKSLRLKQQYFLVCASISDIIRRHLEVYGTLENLADKVAIHINDTHPALAIPELMRVLLDDCGYSWEKAWEIVTGTIAYTNHTVMSEALECWPEDLFKRLLPRIWQIVHEINERFCADLWNKFPEDWERISQMAITAYGQVRMANLAVAGSHSVNGVSTLHSDILKDDLFRDFCEAAPEKFTNVTNGIAHRRWLCQANPDLAALIKSLIGDKFITDASALSELAKYKDDPTVLTALHDIKKQNKQRLCAYVEKSTGTKINPDSLFDVQVKRLHEYKRQHLNALHIISLYNKLKANPDLDIVPRTYLFAAKAAPGYFMAKEIIRLLCKLSAEIDRNPRIREKLRVVYLEDYRVTLAELLMPAADVSEQISLAGTEASGTGNMKLMINGAITLGTMDGANIEIYNAVGPDNIITFGLTTPEVNRLKGNGYRPSIYIDSNPELRRAIDSMAYGFDGQSFSDIAGSLTGADPYMLCADFASYCDAQAKIDALYRDREKWDRMALMNIAGAGEFAADRAIREYAKNIWKIQ